MTSNVLHFIPEGSENTACGTRVFLCDDYTDDIEHVDCKRCRRTKLYINYDPRRFDVDIWDHDGDIVDDFRRVTAEEVDRIRSDYEDDPTVIVSVTES